MEGSEEEGSDSLGITSSATMEDSELELEVEKQWRLYEAYNELHSLAQEFETPFEAPAVLVVGHQTDGKSALVEALMGFQFNHVGGGTKTRRPITLHMKYNPLCSLPLCRLVSDSDSTLADEKSLQQIQVTFLLYLSFYIFIFDNSIVTIVTMVEELYQCASCYNSYNTIMIDSWFERIERMCLILSKLGVKWDGNWM